MRVPNRFFGTRVFRYLKLGIRDLKAKLGRVSVLKVCPRGGMPNITLRITGLYKFWVGITGLKNSYMGPFKMFLSFQKTFQKILYNVTL